MTIEEFEDFDFDNLDLSELSDEEIAEFEAILAEIQNDQLRDTLNITGPNKNPNYNLLVESFRNQRYENKLQVPDSLIGKQLTEKEIIQYTRPVIVAGKRGVILEGSSRSGKTWSSVDFIIFLCLFVEKNCKIFIVRETFAEFADTLYDDFKRRLDDFYLPNPFHGAKVVREFKINGNTIKFIGCDGVGKKHGAGCDYLYFNEMITVPEAVYDQLEMRCRKFWWADYNPSVTTHYIYDKIVTRPDIGFLRTTFLDNMKFIKPGELQKIVNSEPWLPGSYEIRNETDIYYKGEIISEINCPPPHPVNVDQGTADEFYWKVYGLGLRGSMKGLIYTNYTFIPEWPKDMGFIYVNDFGFTVDPNAFGRYTETATDIYFELLIYHPIDSPDLLANTMIAKGAYIGPPMICDSSDIFTGKDKATVEMVRGLQNLGWPADKVRKTQTVIYWIGQVKGKKMHIVNNEMARFVKTELKNYRMAEINGVSINQPIDGFDHALSALRYGHMAWNTQPGEIVW